MATKNFEKMRTKSLQKLMETASDEDKVAIQAILDAREQVSASSQEETAYTTEKVGETTVVTEEPAALSPEEEAAIAAAEANNGEATTKKALSPEEVAAKVEEARKNIGFKCEVLPFGEVEWVSGYIAGVTLDKRSNNIMYRIKTGEKYSHKTIDAKTLRISDEKAEIERHTSSGHASSGEKRSDDEALKLVEESRVNIGRIVEVEGKEGTFTIHGVMHDKRSNAVMYALQNAEGKKMYKVVNSPVVKFTDNWDEDVKKRHTPKEVKPLAERLEDTKKKLEAAKARVEALQAELAKLEEEAAKAEAEQPAEAEPTKEPEAEENLL